MADAHTAENDAPRWLCVCGAMHDGPPRTVGEGFLMHEPSASVIPPGSAVPAPTDATEEGEYRCAAPGCCEGEWVK
jgi:hypothetical protein